MSDTTIGAYMMIIEKKLLGSIFISSLVSIIDFYSLEGKFSNLNI
ncbi:MAG: hypothetical protein WBF90_01595 [Rivularia sp. (in: cyanobacteria)]